MFAAGNGHREIVQALLKYGADKYLTNNQGSSAVSLAQEAGFTKIVKLLSPSPKKMIIGFILIFVFVGAIAFFGIGYTVKQGRFLELNPKNTTYLSGIFRKADAFGFSKKGGSHSPMLNENNYKEEPAYDTEKVKEKLVNFTELNTEIMERQIWISRFWAPLIGGFFMSITLLDMIGCLVRLPVLTALLFPDDSWKAIAWFVAYRIIPSGVTVYLFNRSPWRILLYAAHSTAKRGIWAFFSSATITGMALGFFVIFFVAIFLSAQVPEVPTRLYIFNALSLLIPFGAFFWLKIKPFEPERNYFRVEGPVTSEGRPFKILNYKRLALHPTFVHLDESTIPQAIVFARSDNGGYQFYDHRNRLSVDNKEYLILDLAGLQRMIGESTVKIEDQGGFVAGETEFVTHSTEIKSLNTSYLAGLDSTIGAKAIEGLLDLFFKDKHVNKLLQRILDNAIVEYLGVEKSAQDLFDSYLELRNRGRESASKIMQEINLKWHDYKEHGKLPPSIVGLKPYIEEAKTLTNGTKEILAEWKGFREKLRKAKQELPKALHKNLAEYFFEKTKEKIKSSIPNFDMEGHSLILKETVEYLLNLIGIALLVKKLGFAAGAATECENMVLNLENTLEKSRQMIEEKISEREAVMLGKEQDFYHQVSLKMVDVVKDIFYIYAGGRINLDILDEIMVKILEPTGTKNAILEYKRNLPGETEDKCKTDNQGKDDDTEKKNTDDLF